MLTLLLYVLIVGLVAALLFLVASAVFGRAEELGPLPEGTTATVLPVENIGGGDVRALRFQQVLRGYKAGEVDWALTRLAARIDELEWQLNQAHVALASTGDGTLPHPAPTPHGDYTSGTSGHTDHHAPYTAPYVPTPFSHYPAAAPHATPSHPTAARPATATTGQATAPHPTAAPTTQPSATHTAAAVTASTAGAAHSTANGQSTPPASPLSNLAQPYPPATPDGWPTPQPDTPKDHPSGQAALPEWLTKHTPASTADQNPSSTPTSKVSPEPTSDTTGPTGGANAATPTPAVQTPASAVPPATGPTASVTGSTSPASAPSAQASAAPGAGQGPQIPSDSAVIPGKAGAPDSGDGSAPAPVVPDVSTPGSKGER
ncbi:DivIVA domain-containing protein [Nocardia sp. NPDC050406]|uniref:DivIVA domain-containing protein n=1 Tax=Nocardia sp. NPDC050406 TaxID=3364318 RepID=UPI0037A42AFE